MEPSSPSARAWGDPAIIAICGYAAPPPSTLECIAVDGVDWVVQPRIVVGDAARYAAFRSARAALAKSGTVTLELALSGVPMVTAYRALAIEAWIARRLVRVPSVILANLVLGENAVPEFLQEQCEADVLAPALAEILDDGPARQRQLDAFARIDGIMSTGERTPSQRAADVVRAMLRA